MKLNRMKARSLVVALRISLVAFVAQAGLPSTVLPQANDSSSQSDSMGNTKTVADARFYGLLYPGGGQYYLGQVRHGAAVTAKSISLLGVGTLTLAITNCSFQVSDQGHCVDHRHFGQIAIGSLLIAGGLWVWGRGAADAARDAKAAIEVRNRRSGGASSSAKSSTTTAPAPATHSAETAHQGVDVRNARREARAVSGGAGGVMRFNDRYLARFALAGR